MQCACWTHAISHILLLPMQIQTRFTRQTRWPLCSPYPPIMYLRPSSSLLTVDDTCSLGYRQTGICICTDVRVRTEWRERVGTTRRIPYNNSDVHVEN